MAGPTATRKQANNGSRPGPKGASVGSRIDQLSGDVGRLNMGARDVAPPAEPGNSAAGTSSGAPAAPSAAVEPEKLKSAARSMYYFQTSVENAAARYGVPTALLRVYFADRTAEYVLDNAIPEFSEERLRKAAAAVYFKGLGIRAAAKKYCTAQTDLKLFYDQHAGEWLMQQTGDSENDGDDGLDDFYSR